MYISTLIHTGSPEGGTDKACLGGGMHSHSASNILPLVKLLIQTATDATGSVCIV